MKYEPWTYSSFIKDKKQRPFGQFIDENALTVALVMVTTVISFVFGYMMGKI